MSEDRRRYSDSPMAQFKNYRRRDGSYHEADERRPRRSPGRRNQHLLQLMFTAVLPLLFIVSLILGYTEPNLVFLTLSLVCLLWMWAAQAFVPQARPTITLLYIAMMIVSAASVLWFTTPLIKPAAVPNPTDSTAPSSLFSRDVTASDVSALAAANPTSNAVRPTATPDSKSEAQGRLEMFMTAWMNQDEEMMLAYCTPAWKNSQADPLHAIFTIRGISVPIDDTILNVAGDESYDSRTITMRAEIDKGTGSSPVTYQYDVLMIRVNGVWYIDPNSLSSHT